MTKRACCYCRISTTNKGQTTDNQNRQLWDVAKQKGYEVTHQFADEVSGAKGRKQRQGYDEMIKSATRGEFDIVMVWSVDRLGRDLKELITFLDEMNALGIDLYIHTQGLDSTTPTGRMMFQMCGVFAEFERELLKSRVRAGQERAIAQGKKIGRPSTINDGLKNTIKYLRNEQNLGIRKIATDLNVGVGTVYKVIKEVA